MNFTVHLALLGWPLVALALCATLPARRAVCAAYVAAWLFLPVYVYPITGFPDWSKMTATSISLVAALAVFDYRKMASFRPRWIDLPMIAWCLSPGPAALTNGLGPYEALSTCLDQTVIWGIPYFLGRLYFTNLDSLKDLALGLFFGGLVYTPLCLFELRMSPKLHYMVYGLYAQNFEQSVRFGGWRPTVFMEHGLMVGMWMAMASLAGAWLWISGTLKSIRGIAMPWFVLPLMITAVLCKSSGALVLLAAGIAFLLFYRRYRSPAPIYALGAVVPLYILIRVTGIWSGAEFVEVASLFSSDRAGSLETRLENEDLLAAKAMQRPFFGWGGWGRSRVENESGEDISITDGLWIIEFGQRGFLGLISMVAVFLLPLVALMRRLPVWEWTRGPAAAAALLAIVVALYLIDCIANAMITPFYAVAAGGITGMLLYVAPDTRVAPVRGS